MEHVLCASTLVMRARRYTAAQLPQCARMRPQPLDPPRHRMSVLGTGRLTRRFPCAGAAVFLRRYRDERRASRSRSSHRVLRLKTADDVA
eukprot:scaffold25696_cov66-Phaeocystis_antarctica.AAC.6